MLHTKLLKTCRLCLIDEHVEVDIFEHKDVYYKMTACLPITISSDDKLPPKICFECRNKLDSFYDFWDQVRVSEKRLFSCLSTETKAISSDVNEDTIRLRSPSCDDSESRKSTVKVDYCEKAGYASFSEDNSVFEQLQGLGEELIYLYVESEETEQNVNQLVSSVDKFHSPNSSNQFNFIVDTCTDDVKIADSADNAQISSYSVEFPKSDERSTCRSKSSRKRKLVQSSDEEQLESYLCSICDASFSDKVEYHRHEVTHYVDYPYECALCGEHFKRSKQLDNHKSFRHMEDWFSSSETEMVAGDEFDNDVVVADEWNALDYSNETIGSEQVCCEICEKIFENETSCEIHMKKHDIDGVIVCELCGQQFSASKNHRCTKIHFNGSDDTADNVFKKLVWVDQQKASYEIRRDDDEDDDHESRDDLKTIKKLRLKLRKSTTSDVSNKRSSVNGGKSKRNVSTKHRSGGDDVFKCRHCDEQFNTSAKRNRHEKNLHSKRDVKYDCDKCSYSTYTKGCFTTHLKRHIKQYNLFCEECNLGFFNNTELTSHNIKSHDMQPFQCAICNDMFTSKGNLYSHIKSHDPNNSYVCEICGRTYKKKNSYKRHIARSHLGLTTKAQCLVCQKVLSSKEHLRRHMLTHTDERNWVCSTCGKCFLSKTYLTEHSRIHLGIRPYKCEICEKSFTQRGSLTIHKRSHTGERPFRCEYCNKGFVMSTLLRYHLKKCGEAKLGTHFFSHSVISTAPAAQADLSSSKMENVRAIFGNELGSIDVIEASEMDPLNNCTVIHSTN